jgi:hypothetical protein
MKEAGCASHPLRRRFFAAAACVSLIKLRTGRAGSPRREVTCTIGVEGRRPGVSDTCRSAPLQGAARCPAKPSHGQDCSDCRQPARRLGASDRSQSAGRMELHEARTPAGGPSRRGRDRREIIAATAAGLAAFTTKRAGAATDPGHALLWMADYRTLMAHSPLRNGLTSERGCNTPK